MSSYPKIKELTVLCPNGRRVNIKTNPSTSIGQIIEDASSKHGFDPYDYNMKFLHRNLDPSSTLHYSNIPNHAQLELIKAVERRREGLVTVNLVTDKGQRLIADFSSSTSLWDIVTYHETQPGSSFCIPTASSGFQPFIVYTMRRIMGEDLKTTTLKSLGLFSGKCMMRYNVQKTEASMSSPRVVVSPQTIHKMVQKPPGNADGDRQFDGKSEKRVPEPQDFAASDAMECDPVVEKSPPLECRSVTEKDLPPPSQEDFPTMEGLKNDNSQSHILEAKGKSDFVEVLGNGGSPSCETSKPCVAAKRHNSVPEIIPLSDHNSVLFSLDDAPTVAPAQESDEFFELTLGEVGSLYRERVNQLKEMEEAPLMTSTMRQLEDDSRMLSALNHYPVTQLRICFPDRHVIQANFKPHNTVREVMDFVAPLLVKKDLRFHLYTTFPRRVLEPSASLVEADCIPNARLYFGADEGAGESFLSEETRSKKSSFEAATRAVKIANQRSTTREGSSTSVIEPLPSSSQSSFPTERNSPTGAISRVASTAKQGVPKWLKLGK